jgi:hypothetical protein
MKILKSVILLFLLAYLNLSAQFSVPNFLDEPLTKTFSELKESISDKKIEDSMDGPFNHLTYYDWLEPLSIKINFMFKKDGKPVSKSISNSKKTDEEAQKLFNILISELVYKYGQSISQKTLFGAIVYTWNGVGGSIITLSHTGNKTVLMIIIFK